ncbi:MAG: radical SAM protein [Desulfurococcales archaeon]|nr:radical SAM protein [Desulfurococcales archaeon]
MIPVSILVTGRGTVSERITGRRGRRPSRFTTTIKPIIFWNLTYKCNLHCSHCYINAGPSGGPELGVGEKLRIAEELSSHGIPHVVLTGGEPLLAKGFWSLASRLAELGRPSMSLSSNGTLIDDRTSSRLAELGFKYAGVSLDSVRPEVHDKFRGLRGSFKRTVRGIRSLIDYGIPVGVRTTITRWNIGEIPEVIDLAASLGASRVALYMLDTVGRGRLLAGDLPTPGQAKRLLDTLVEKAREYAGTLEILLVRFNQGGVYIAKKLSRTPEELKGLLEVIGSQGDCGRKAVSIYPDGRVKPCQFIDHIDLGDLRRESLSTILNPANPRLKPFLETHKMLRGPRCSHCPYKEYCGGGSRGRALALTGDFWGDDPLCPLEDG